MSNYQISLVIMACVSMITVCGVFCITSLAGMFSLGQAAYMSISAYLTFCLARYLKLPLLSVCFAQMVSAIVILLGDWTNASVGFSKIPKVKNLVYIVLGITALIIFMVRNLKYSRFGRMLIALKTDEIAARSFGIDVYRLKVKVYVFASMLAAVGGILYGLRNRVISPDAFDWSLSAEMQILLFFGGTNSLTGSMISAAGLKVLPEFLKGVKLFGIDLQSCKTIIYCVLILVIINFRTHGLMGESELSLRGLRRLADRREAGAKGGDR